MRGRGMPSFGHRIEAVPEAVTIDATLPPPFYTCGGIWAPSTVGASSARPSLSAKLTSKTLNLLQRLHKADRRKMCLAIEHHLDIPTDDDYYPHIFVVSLCGMYNSPERQMYNYCSCIGPPVVGSALQLQRMSYTNNAQPPPSLQIQTDFVY